MAKLGTVNASTLGPRDLIEVPVETCEIISIERIPGQLKDRSGFLVRVKVAPIGGPWANCEGTFVVESRDQIPLVKKYTNKERRREARRKFFASIWNRFFSPKAEPIPSLPAPSTSTGPMT